MKNTFLIIAFCLGVGFDSFAQSISHSGGSSSTTTCGTGTVTIQFASIANNGSLCTTLSSMNHHWYTTPTGGTEVSKTLVTRNCNTSFGGQYITSVTVTGSSSVTYYVMPKTSGGTSMLAARVPVTATINQGTSISAGIQLNNNPTVAHCEDDMVFSATGGTVLNWYRNGSIITGETGATYVPTQSGNYKVKVLLLPQYVMGQVLHLLLPQMWEEPVIPGTRAKRVLLLAGS